MEREKINLRFRTCFSLVINALKANENSLTFKNTNRCSPNQKTTVLPPKELLDQQKKHTPSFRIYLFYFFNNNGKTPKLWKKMKHKINIKKKEKQQKHAIQLNENVHIKIINYMKIRINNIPFQCVERWARGSWGTPGRQSTKQGYQTGRN